jgi:hypothetical protein
VFSSIGSYSYPIVVTDDRFLTTPINMTDVSRIVLPGIHSTLEDLSHDKSSEAAAVSSSAFQLSQKALTGTLEKLDVSSCMTAYAQNFVTSRGGLVLVLDTPGAATGTLNATIFDMIPSWSLLSADWCQWDQYSWVCRQDGMSACYPPPQCCPGCHCDELCQVRLPAIRANSSGWRPFNQEFPVKYCLSEVLPEQCRLQASVHVAAIVVVLNIVKAALMYATVFGIRESPLMTIGDAIASFLSRQDSSSKDLGLVSISDIRHGTTFGLGAASYSPLRRRWFSAASKWRWAACIFM